MRFTRRDTLRAAALCTFGASALAPQGAAAGAGPERLLRTGPRPLPEFLFLTADGAERRVADYAGRGLVINLWATWCPPCVAEMPALDRLHALLAPDAIEVLALSSDRGGAAQVAPFYERLGLRNLAILLDPLGRAARALGARGLPTTVVVGREGQELARLEGAAEWDRPDMVAALGALIGPLPGRPADRA
ncbi:MAG: TlpA family protein disulfide reductase [Acetobacteraceae bacterium]|nr:TlpA family protein disulfide reductase [Acetobacteraceae bacterium]MCX7685423.1 TlpA family protein disulfide reductase [Acetobacteraceae bacterium]MDW8399370.1 TlpA disulfide reductase family protein [Acetobacteraceae bacterium]